MAFDEKRVVQKCQLCGDGQFVMMPGWGPSQHPMGWRWVQVMSIGPQGGSVMILICPFCVSVAEALQTSDVERTQAESSRPPTEANKNHPFYNAGWGIPDSPCTICGRPDRDPIHYAEKMEKM